MLQNPQYRWFLGSWATASTGYSVFAISVIWLALQVSHSFLVVGLVLGVERAAYCATFLVAPLADRVRNQRTIFVVSFPVQALCAAFLGWSALTGSLGVAELIGFVAVLSVLWDLSWAAANAAPGILLSADDQFAGTGAEGLLGGLNSIVGFAAGGGLVLLVGAGGGMILFAGLLGLATLLALPLRISSSGPRDASFWSGLRRGWATVVAGPGRPLLQLGAVDAVEGFVSVAPILLLALVAVRLFQGSAEAYALLFVAYVVGGVLAGLLFAHWNPRGRVGGVIVGTLLVGALTLLLVEWEPAVLALAVGVWFAVGFVQSAYQDAKYAFLRGAVPSDQLGRVVSNLYVFPGVASTLGAVAIGALALAVPGLSLAGWLAIILVGAGILAVILPGVRRLSF